VTVDSDTGQRSTGSQLDELILALLEERGVLPTATVADEIDEEADTVNTRLEMLAQTGLIEHRETINGDVWLAW